MMPAIDSDAVVVGDHAHFRRQRIFASVQRQHGLAVVCAAHDQISRHLGGIENVQRGVRGRR